MMAGIKLKTLPLFPSSVDVTSPLTLVENGNFLFGVDVNALTTSLDPFSADSPAQAAYWAPMYRLLDPAAYVAVNGLGLPVTVPAGQPYYALNTWWVRINRV